jgi:hypothetical protein
VASPTDLAEEGEPLEERILVATVDCLLPGEEPKGVLAIDGWDQLGEYVVERFGTRDDPGCERSLKSDIYDH